MEVVFRPGDIRSTILNRVRELSRSGRPATRAELMNSMLHHVLAAGVDEDEIGDLSPDKMPSPTLHCVGLSEDGPVPVYTSKTKFSALILNLRNLSRGRKRPAPSAYAAGRGTPSSSAIVIHDSGDYPWEYSSHRWPRQQKRIPPLGCVCVFHLDSKIAATKVGLAHEALGTILVSATGRNQESMDIRGGMYQSTLDCFLEAWTGSPKCFRMCHPRGQHVSANSPCLLKQHENQLGRPYKEGTRPDWNTFPRLDPLVATVLEWGHSTDDDQWAQAPSVQLEYKVSVSEWLLHSTSAAYLLPDRDDDAHTPLLIEVPRTNTLVGG